MDLSGLVGMFVGVHATLAMFTKTPELQISEDQGAAYMKAAADVMRHYSVTATQKGIDWMIFTGATLGMYAPMIAAVRVRQAEEKRIRAATGVAHFPAAEARRRSLRPVETPPGQPGGQAGDIIPDPLFNGEGPEAA